MERAPRRTNLGICPWPPGANGGLGYLDMQGYSGGGIRLGSMRVDRWKPQWKTTDTSLHHPRSQLLMG